MKTLVVLMSLLVVLGSAVVVKKNIRPYNITSVLDPKGEVFHSYRNHEQKYQDELQVFVLMESKTPWTEREDFYPLLADTTEKLKRVPFLESVSSLYDSEYVVRENNRTFLRTFFYQGHLRSEGLQQLKNNPLYQYSFLDPTGKATLISLRVKENLSFQGPSPILKNVREILESMGKQNPSFQYYLLGTEVARDAFITEVIKGQSKILPLILLLILGLMYALFRNFRVCFLSFYVMAMSYFLTVLMVTFVEGSINPFSSFALLFILIISTADLVHLFSAVSHGTNPDPKLRLKEAIDHIITPCWICALTTWIGLLSLLAADIPPVRWFGVYCAFGSAIAFVLTFYVLPKLIVLFNVNMNFKPPFIKLEGAPTHRWAARFKTPIILGFLALILGLGHLSTKLKAADNLYDKFVKGHALSQAVTKFQEYFHFSGSIDLVLEAPHETFWSPQNEEALKELEKELSAIPGVAHVKGLSGFQRQIRSLYQGKGDSRVYPLDKDKELKGAVGFSEDFSVTDSFLLPGHDESRIMIFLNSLESEEMLQVTKEVEKVANRPKFEKLFRPSVRGFSTVRSEILHSIYDGFVKSFALDFACIFLSFIIFFRSVRWAIIAMIPNLIPLVAVGGLMQMLGIKFDFNLIVMVALILGIAVDDTTHFLHYLLQSLKNNEPMEIALEHAVKQTSVALTSTTFIFVLTLPTFYLTNVLMFNEVASILILSLILGLAGDMIVLPALLSVDKISTFLTRRIYERSNNLRRLSGNPSAAD